MKLGGLKYWAITLLFCVVFFAVNAQSKELIGLKPSGYVNDFAGIINAETKTNLERILTAYNTATTIEIAVATVNSLNDMVIDDYAVRLFDEWKIGEAKKDNGVLFVIAPNEKKMRIEVGYGLEGALNDAKAGRIISSTGKYFRDGNFSGGIQSAVLDIMSEINSAENITFDPNAQPELAALAKRKPKKEGGNNFLFFLPIIIFFVIFANRIMPGSKNAGKGASSGIWFLGGFGGGSGGSSGGFGGSGFGGFGGGFSGGGGASGGW